MKLFVIALLLVLLAATFKVASSQEYCKPSHYLTRAASPDSKRLPPEPKSCEDGPSRIIHTVPNQFYWPPIYKGSCDKLKCKDPPCIARKTVWRWRCVLLYEIIHGLWKRVGFRRIHFLDHLSCSCKECGDIKNKYDCANTDPCPNSKNPDSFCFYKSNKCACCEPYPCPPGHIFDTSSCSCVCPVGTVLVGDKCVSTCSEIKTKSDCIKTDPCPESKNPDSFCFYKSNKCACCEPYSCPDGQIFDKSSCSCVCPDGSKNVKGKCVGDCSDISLAYCKNVLCDLNPQFNCFVDKYKCVCPSCDLQRSATQCPKTRCVEQKGNPDCVYDIYLKKCRCPRCSDIKDKKRCLSAYCEDGYPRCKYNFYSKKCFCPKY